MLVHNISNNTMSRRAVGSCKNVMEDCRQTDYTPNCQLNEYLKNKYAPGSSSEYRQYLIHNGCKIMDELRQRSQNMNQNPTGCKCQYDHKPHDPVSQAKYSWRPSAGFLAQKNKNFNTPLPAPSSGKWTNFC